MVIVGGNPLVVECSGNRGCAKSPGIVEGEAERVDEEKRDQKPEIPSTIA